MKHKINLVSMAIVLMMVAVASCSPAKTPEPKAQLKVALLLNGPINDLGWGQQSYEGLMAIKEKFNAQTAYSENVPETDRVELLRNYAKQNFNIIFANSFEFGEALQTVSKEYPNVTFVHFGGYETNSTNLGTIEGGEVGVMGYISGVGAALMTKSNKVGLIGAVDIPVIANEFAAFEQGLKAINPNATAITAYTGSWTDVEGAREAALAQISSGADVLLANGDAANIGAIGAAKEKGVKVIGFNRDQSGLAPDFVMFSVLYPIDQLMVKEVDRIVKGEFKGEYFNVSTKQGGITLSSFHQSVPKDVQDKILAAFEQLKNGEIKIDLPYK